MKKIVLIAFAISLFHNFATSQWFQQNSGTTGDLKSVYFVNPLTGWVCGVTGTQSTDRIAKTTDGGTTWVKQNAGTFYVLNSIQFINDQTGWAAGLHGTVVKTTNGGTNWYVVFGTTSWDWQKVQFVDAQIGWVAGFTDAIFRTTDGGLNWSGINFNGSGTRSFFFINQNTGWLPISSFNGKVNKTTNGGISWTEIDQPSVGVFDVYFLNSNVGWMSGSDLSGNGIIYRTSDGGLLWEIYVVASPQNISKFDFIDSDNGWATGTAGSIYITKNGGVNWSLQNVVTNSDLLSIFMLDSSLGWAVGKGGVVLKTTNGGGPVGLEYTSSDIPASFSLGQNYPNPFNPVTKISFNFAERTNVKLCVFDIQGKELDVLVNQLVNPGSFEIVWNAAQYPSGVYFYRLETQYFTETKKMILLK